MVGIVVTISPSFSLYRIVVFPAASRPTVKSVLFIRDMSKCATSHFSVLTHENSHLFLAKESRKHAGYRQTHGGVVGLELQEIIGCSSERKLPKAETLVREVNRSKYANKASSIYHLLMVVGGEAVSGTLI